MPPIREHAVERIHRDHDYMIELAQRIKAACTAGGGAVNCGECHPNLRQVCHGNIDELIRTFVETTLKHNLIESLLMEDGMPLDHRIAHKQAHLDIAKQMKAIRAVFSADGNCILAIEGIDTVVASLQAHSDSYDLQLEKYLLQTA
jgi:hemerythrin